MVRRRVGGVGWSVADVLRRLDGVETPPVGYLKILKPSANSGTRIAWRRDRKPHPKPLVARRCQQLDAPWLRHPHAAREDHPLAVFRTARSDPQVTGWGIGVNVFQHSLAARVHDLQRDDPVAAYNQPELREPEAFKL